MPHPVPLLIADAADNYWRLIVEGLVLAGALLAGALVIRSVDRWRRRQNEMPTPAQTLAAFKLSYERGELSAEEYARIRARLATRGRPQATRSRPQEPASDLVPLDDEPPLNTGDESPNMGAPADEPPPRPPL